MKVLIVGGAGFIGGVTAQLFKEAGHEVVIFDNLTTGHQRNIEGLTLIKADCGDQKALDQAFADHKFDAVLDFAAVIQVGESMEKPRHYFTNNTFGLLAVLDTAARAGVSNFIFSSTGSVYGNQDVSPITEELAPQPINPYATSKYLSEQLLNSYHITGRVNWTAFRYFNVSGAYKHIGPDYPFRTHLLPSIIHAMRQKQPVKLFGDDYDTPDGTCVRDYIHVYDIARAHVMAAEKMLDGLAVNRPVNLGTGHGYSVKEMIDTVERVSGSKIERKNEPRRSGDAAKTVASNVLAHQLFGWQPQKNLDDIVSDALEWDKTYKPA